MKKIIVGILSFSLIAITLPSAYALDWGGVTFGQQVTQAQIAAGKAEQEAEAFGRFIDSFDDAEINNLLAQEEVQYADIDKAISDIRRENPAIETDALLEKLSEKITGLKNVLSELAVRYYAEQLMKPREEGGAGVSEEVAVKQARRMVSSQESQQILMATARDLVE